MRNKDIFHQIFWYFRIGRGFLYAPPVTQYIYGNNIAIRKIFWYFRIGRGYPLRSTCNFRKYGNNILTRGIYYITLW
jgi:hypothetical protein